MTLVRATKAKSQGRRTARAAACTPLATHVDDTVLSETGLQVLPLAWLDAWDEIMTCPIDWPERP